MPDLPSLLLSFCNVAPGAPVLALYDVGRAAVDVIRTPDALSLQGGATGLALGPDFLFVATTRTTGSSGGREPAGPSGVFAFDRRDLTPKAWYACRTVFDAHSLVLDGDSLLVVSTGTDAIVRLRLDGPRVVDEEQVWCAGGDAGATSADRHHLNALTRWQGRWLVSAFGPRPATLWSSARDGYVLDIETGERILSGLGQPHSLTPLSGGNLAFCESSTRTVRILGTTLQQALPGYPRGLCAVGSSLFAATSRGRLVSKSTGRLTGLSEPGTVSGDCAIVELGAADLAVQRQLQINHLGWEIYEVLPVTGTAGWPVLGPVEWRDHLIDGLRSGDAERDARIAWLHTEVAERDRTVTWLHGEVAERDRTVEWLHGEVARRDRELEDLRRRREPGDA